MAQIAEDLFLLLVDNASAQPGLERGRRQRVLSGAVLLDLAHACRIRPAMAGEPVEPGRLLALSVPGPMDPVSAPAFQLLERRPLRPATAVKRLSKHTEETVANYLVQTGQIGRVRLNSKRLRHPYAWPLINRQRVGHARSAMLAALFDRRPPAPPTAAIISLLHAVDGLGALLSLNDRGWRWVHSRAGEIASGSWVDEYPTALPEVNLAITASVVRAALT
jgi:Golgi phosphoprotein 3 (GPP34)